MKWTAKSTSNSAAGWSSSASARSGRARCRCCCATSTCRYDRISHRHGRRARPRGSRALRHKVPGPSAHARELSRRPRAPDRQGRFSPQSFGRRLQRRAHRAVLREGRDVPRHVHRAVARRLHRSRACRPRTARITDCAKRCSRCARSIPTRADGHSDARREPRAHLALGEAGDGQYRARHRRRRRHARSRATNGRSSRCGSA